MTEGYGHVLLDIVMADAHVPEQDGATPLYVPPAPVAMSIEPPAPSSRATRYLIAAGIGAAIVGTLHLMGVL